MAFLNRLTQALLRYTNIDPETPEGRQLLMSHFFSQSAPDIQNKLRKLEKGLLTPHTEILKVAFQVYHGRDTRAQKQLLKLLTQAVPASRKPEGQRGSTPAGKSTSSPRSPCFKCGQAGHWAGECPNPRPPPGPCPKCHQRGHWGVNCP